MSLKDYKQKRRFENTPEPSGDTQVYGDQARFVVHAIGLVTIWICVCRCETVLKVGLYPKESLKPSEQKFAFVEDHPLEYADLEE